MHIILFLILYFELLADILKLNPSFQRITINEQIFLFEYCSHNVMTLKLVWRRHESPRIVNFFTRDLKGYG